MHCWDNCLSIGDDYVNKQLRVYTFVFSVCYIDLYNVVCSLQVYRSNRTSYAAKKILYYRIFYFLKQ